MSTPSSFHGRFRRIAFGTNADTIAVDDHVIAVDFDLAREAAVRRVAARQVRIRVRIAEVVNGNDLDFRQFLPLSYKARSMLRPMRP